VRDLAVAVSSSKLIGLVHLDFGEIGNRFISIC